MPRYDWQKRFYLSRAWRAARAYVLQRDAGVCRICGEHIFFAPVVHHTTELTQANVSDPAVSLDPDVLVTVCIDCHNREHERLGYAAKDIIVGDDLEIDYTRRGI